jgi:hypothetical protein
MEKLKLRNGISMEEKESYITRSDEIGTLLFDYERDRIYETNESGSIIIKLCDGEHTKEEIVDGLCNEYDAEMGKIKEDVDEFFKKLDKYKLLE